MPVQWTKRLELSGEKLTLKDLRMFVTETDHLPDDQVVWVATDGRDGREGNYVKLSVNGAPHA